MVVKQICYYNESDIYQELNYPKGLKASALINGLIFTDAIYDEIQIRAFPGTLLEVNGQSIVIGEIGVYNILYEENMKILTVRVESSSIKTIQQVEDAFIVITVLRDD